MSSIKLINASCVEQEVDAIVNAANKYLQSGGGIFGGRLDNPPQESAKQCLRAYKKIIEDYKGYNIDVILCVYTEEEYVSSKTEFS